MIKSCLDFLGLWWELGHPTFPNQHFRALGSSIILDRWSKDIESWSVIRIQELGLFHQKNPQFHLPLLFFFCFKELCGQHDSFSHPPAEKNPPGSEQRLRESGGALHRALAMPGVDHGRPAPPTWCRLMRENDDDTWCYNPHWIKGWIWDDWDDWDVFFFLLTVATKAIWRNKLIFARYHNRAIWGAPRCRGTCWTFRRPLDWFLAEKFHWVHQDVSGDLCSFMEHVPWNMSDLLIDFVYVCIL